MTKDENLAEDYADPAVCARFAEHQKKRHYPADTYRLQDSCANCAHVFIRQEYDADDELFCTFLARPRPPCRSVLMGECDRVPGQPLGCDTEGQEQWEVWKNEVRQVVGHGICGE